MQGCILPNSLVDKHTLVFKLTFVVKNLSPQTQKHLIQRDKKLCKQMI